MSASRQVGRQVGNSQGWQLSMSAGRQAGMSGGSAGRQAAMPASRRFCRQVGNSPGRQLSRSAGLSILKQPRTLTNFSISQKIWNDDLTKSGCFWCDAPTPRPMLVRCVRRRPAAVQRGDVVGPPWPVRVWFLGARCASASSVPSGMPAFRGLDFERSNVRSNVRSGQVNRQNTMFCTEAGVASRGTCAVRPRAKTCARTL